MLDSFLVCVAATTIGGFMAAVLVRLVFKHWRHK